jgi:UDP-GlcNAc:undecaprenyl-phosphate GlcNAc-1-phosphate transferase
LTWVVRRYARLYGFVDRPDGGRKSHQAPVALGGGVAIFGALLIAATVACVASSWAGVDLFVRADWKMIGGLLAAGFLIVLLGLFDDLRGMRGRYKLLGQVLIALLLVYSGMRIEKFALFGQLWELHWLAVPFTVFWFLGSINTINLIDGIDGLASSVGLVLSLTIAAITFSQGNALDTIIMLALAGALLGFLRFNFAPASIFLGDSGSMLIGLLIGAIAIHAWIKSAAVFALIVPVAVWTVPILDSAAAIVRRKLTGRSLFAPDRGHLHHSLLVRGWSVRQAVLFISLISATTCLSAVMSLYFKNELIALFTVLALAAFLVFSRTFGHIEFALLKDHVRFTAMSLSTRENQKQNGIHESRIHMQGARPWDKLWTAIVESAEDYHLVRIKLSLDIPALDEAYYATWNAGREEKEAADRLWKIQHPLLVESQLVGILELVGVTMTGSTSAHMIQVLDFLEPLEEDIRQIMEQLQQGQETGLVGRNSLLRLKLAEGAPPPEALAPTGILPEQHSALNG